MHYIISHLCYLEGGEGKNAIVLLERRKGGREI